MIVCWCACSGRRCRIGTAGRARLRRPSGKSVCSVNIGSGPVLRKMSVGPSHLGFSDGTGLGGVHGSDERRASGSNLAGIDTRLVRSGMVDENAGAGLRALLLLVAAGLLCGRCCCAAGAAAAAAAAAAPTVVALLRARFLPASCAAGDLVALRACRCPSEWPRCATRRST
jgi:hypothetical protein